MVSISCKKKGRLNSCKYIFWFSRADLSFITDVWDGDKKSVLVPNISS